MIRSSGTRCTCTVTSVMTPSRPSLPRIISRTLGPVAVLGSGRMTSTSPGTTTRKPRVMSAMSPYLSDCMPDDRVATQPPRVEWVKESGKWPMVQPRAPSCSSRSGPSVPAWMRASPDSASMSSTLFSRPRSTESTGRDSSGGGSRLPEMLVPPPNGMITTSSAMARSTIARTWSSSAGYRTASGIRGMIARRSRTRSRRLLPYVCTIRSRVSVWTCSSPSASFS